MIPILSIYRFNSPFFKKEDETIFFNNFVENINYFMKNQNVEFLKTAKRFDNYSMILFDIENIWKIEISLLNKLDIVLPIMDLSISFEQEILENNFDNILWFITWFLELFDSKNENKFCLEYNNMYLNPKNITSQITTINNISKIIDKKNIISELNKILEWNNNIDKEILEKNYIYFVYLMLTMHKNISKIAKQKAEIEKIEYVEENNSYKWHIDLSLLRLEDIENQSIANYKNFYSFIEKLYNKLSMK